MTHDDMVELARRIALVVNVHKEKHTFSCVKVPRYDKDKCLVCRYGVKYRKIDRTKFQEQFVKKTGEVEPKEDFTEHKVPDIFKSSDTPLVVLNVQRKEDFARRVAEFMTLLTIATMGNNCTVCLGCEGQARPICCYLSGYMAKSPNKVLTTLPVIHKMFGRAKIENEKSRSEKQKMEFLKAKMVNGFSTMIEYPDTQVPSSLLGYPSIFSNHKIEWLDMRGPLRWQGEQHNIMVDWDLEV